MLVSEAAPSSLFPILPASFLDTERAVGHTCSPLRPASAFITQTVKSNNYDNKNVKKKKI